MPKTLTISFPDGRHPEATPPGTECPGGICTRIEEYHDKAYFLGNKFLGVQSIPHTHTNGGASAFEQNCLYFCPVCGEVWLRTITTPHEAYSRGPVHWRAVERLCRLHGSGLITDQNFYGETYRGYPIPVLQHDVLLLKESPCS